MKPPAEVERQIERMQLAMTRGDWHTAESAAKKLHEAVKHELVMRKGARP